MALDEEVDRLYGLPLEEFTAARNRLAAALKKQGKTEDADAVKSLRKPSASAWAVNQLARKERLQVRSLVTSADRLRKAQESLLRGGAADELRASVERQREVVRALVKRAKEILGEAGHPATEATLERVRETLTAVAGDEEGAWLVEQGRLETDLDPAGFGPMTAAPPATKKRDDRSERKAKVEGAKKELDELRAELREREEQARRAAQEAAKADKAAKEAESVADKAQAALERLTQRLEEAKEALERARSS
jgi:chromosome segregation ATPase